MAATDAQRTDVNETTADPATRPAAGDRPGSPTGPGVEQAAAPRPGQAGRGPIDHDADGRPRVPLDPPTGGVNVVRDDTDGGGPLVVQSADPDLNPPTAPQDPFPTDGTPEIDPPVRRGT